MLGIFYALLKRTMKLQSLFKGEAYDTTVIADSLWAS